MAIILLTNDDGVHAAGLKTLAEETRKWADVYVVAPDRERSAAGHSLTIHKPLRVNDLGDNIYSISGTPTDCVAIAVEKILPARPDLIISGINHGPNLGDDITYSGTVAGAMEGTIMDIPSIAVSLNMINGADPHFATAAEQARIIAEFVLKHSLPYDTLLNVNVPNLPLEAIKGIRITRQGKRKYEGAIQDARSPWGETYYWIGGGTPYWEHGEDTDICTVQDGHVSVTPVHLDLTNYSAMGYISGKWGEWISRNSGS